MASNGIVFRPGRGPSFILVGLVVIVIILFYSYWGVSSKNNKLLRDVSVLQDRLRVLAARKLTADKKGSALVSQITQMQDEKEKVINSKDSKIAQMAETLQSREDELTKVRKQEKRYQAELEKLKKGVNSSAFDLQNLKGRADELLKKYRETKESRSLLVAKVANLTAERGACQKELVLVKLELAEQKKSQDAKLLSSDKNVSDKTNDEKKVNDEGESVSDDSDKDRKESEKDDNKKDDKPKESEKDDESNNDENAETAKEEKEKESLEVKSPVPSRASANQNNASVSRNIPENIKPDGNKSRVEETDKRNQSNPDNSEDMEKEAGKDEGNTEQPKKEESPEEDKDLDSQLEAASDIKITDDENEEDEREKELSDEDLDGRGRMERSLDSAADMRRRIQPLPGKMTGNAQPAGNVEEIRNLDKNPMDPQGLMSRRINPLDIPSKLEEMGRRKEAEDRDQ